MLFGVQTIVHNAEVVQVEVHLMANCTRINFHLASCSMDDTVGVVSGANFGETSMIKHDNQTGRWISSFRYIISVY